MSDVKLYWSQDNQNESLFVNKEITISPDDALKSSNILFHSDNLIAMKYLINMGFARKIDLIYIDPPFTATRITTRERKTLIMLRFLIFGKERSASIWI